MKRAVGAEKSKHHKTQMSQLFKKPLCIKKYFTNVLRARHVKKNMPCLDWQGNCFPLFNNRSRKHGECVERRYFGGAENVLQCDVSNKSFRISYM
jgi:hypothetical protein